MTRSEYIHAVKAKIDEITPFDDPEDCIALEGENDSQKVVKPITETIDLELDNAAQLCLNLLPLTLLSPDIQSRDYEISVDSNGVGRIAEIYDYMRLVRLHIDEWWRDVASFISTSSPMYSLQQNKYTRGGLVKPVAAINPEEHTIECYSVSNATNHGMLYFVDTNDVVAEDVESQIQDYIVIMCSALVFDSMGEIELGKLMRSKFAEKLESIIK